MPAGADRFDFDSPPERRGGDSLKWNRWAARDVLPMWVADMDFRCAPPIREALQARVEHGVFGYAEPWPALVEAVTGALWRDCSWRIEPDWLLWLPGLVSALNVVSRAIGAEGDAVLTTVPIYPPFLSAPRNQARALQPVSLALRDRRWEIDWPAMEAAVTPRTRLLLFCSPHNPVGRAYSRAELLELAAFCARHDLVLCSDEIHCGLMLDADARHLPVASLDPAIAARTITLMAASKTWNLPGLGCAFAVVPDAGLRARLQRTMRGIVPHVNLLGMHATEAAYRHGGPWRQALLAHLRGNRACLQEAIAGMAGLSMTPVEATYLAWIDCRELGLPDPQRFFEEAGVGLSDGRDFGAPGWVRLNFGCSRALLDEALARMRRALGT